MIKQEKLERTEKANAVIKIIASCGRRFFHWNGIVSKIEIGNDGKIFFIDCFSQKRIYISERSHRWIHFSEGGTLRSLIEWLAVYIKTGKLLNRGHFYFPEWYSEGDPWGYGDDMKIVQSEVEKIGIVDK